MNEIMRGLHRDHANFIKIFRILEENLQILKEGESPDYDIILDALDYLQHYGHQYHHPKEDAIYRYHLEHHDSAWDAVDRLLDEHDQLARVTNKMREHTYGVVQGAVMRRDEYVDELEAFIATHSTHLKIEEMQIFPIFEKDFTAAEWQEVEKLVPTIVDPLFGNEVAGQYQGLYERVTGDARTR